MTGYPPCNIIQTDEDHWLIEIACAGFSAADVEVEEHSGVLHVRGRSNLAERAGDNYLHRGLARRDFNKQIRLGEHVHVSGSPIMQHGVLCVSLEREVPEAQRPKRFTVEDVPSHGNQDPVA